MFILYTPNKLQDVGAAPTSPRTYYTYNSLERTVAQPEFALGLLLNKLEVRRRIEGAGQHLDDVVGAGTPTSRFWLQTWFETWTANDAPYQADDSVAMECCADAVENIIALHTRSLIKGPLLRSNTMDHYAHIDGSRKMKCVI